MALSIIRGSLLAASGLFAFSSVGQAGVPIVRVPRATAHHAIPRGTDRSLSVLYDQTSNGSGTSFVSQNFESTFSNYDTLAADDFIVPEGQTWVLKEIDVIGVYLNGYGPAASEDVVLYKDSHGKPGNALANGVFDNIVGADNAGSFAIKLSHAVRLKSGKHYWVSVAANCSFQDCGEWGWDLQTTHENDNAKFKTPSSDWADIGTGDLMFVLKGKTKS